MTIFAKIGKVVKIAKNLLSNKTESEIQELTNHLQQAVQETGDVVDATKTLGKEAGELVDEMMLVATLALAILQRFQGTDSETRDLYPAMFEQLVEQGVTQLS